jgi:hypothetical protein
MSLTWSMLMAEIEDMSPYMHPHFMGVPRAWVQLFHHLTYYSNICLTLGPIYDHFYDGYYTLFPHVHMCFSYFKGAF